MSLFSILRKNFSKKSRNEAIEELRMDKIPSFIPARYFRNIDRYKLRENDLFPKDLINGFIHNKKDNIHDTSRFFTFHLIYDQLKKENISGDIAELGVYKGNTAYILGKYAKAIGRTTYLFDTFEGFDPKDIKGIDSSISLQFSDTSLKAVQNFVGEENVVYVKGYFPESASQIPDDLKFCMVHIDCDLYSPMMSALNYFYPRMTEGGFIVLHDYSSLHWDGAENAADEFFSDKQECLIPLADYAGSAIVRKARTPNKFTNWRIKWLYDLSVRSWVQSPFLKTYLKDGWADVEDWGVWGVGESHTISLIIPFRHESDVKLIFDVDALLLGQQMEQKVSVLVEGTEVAKWTFTPDFKRREREFIIPKEMIDRIENGDSPPTLCVEFKPEFFTSPNTLDPSNSDTRALGLAIYKFKIEVE